MRTPEALEKLGISRLNEMQEAVYAASATGKDMVILSPTGSGKTVAFMLAVLERLDPGYKNVQALVLTPSRELALQTEQVFRKAGTGFKVGCFYGGHSVSTERNSLAQPPVVMIGTPGRIAFHLEAGNFDESAVRTLVIDEFDKCMELGFQADMAYIIRQLRSLERRILTSATNADEIPDFAGLHDPVKVDFISHHTALSKLVFRKINAVATGRDKALLMLLGQTDGAAALVFCNERETASDVFRMLKAEGFTPELYHGGMEQAERERALLKFRNGTANLLVTTDLASRGLDIPEVAVIIHYQPPLTEAAFIHRNGRTARMNAEGTVYMIALADGEYAFSDEHVIPEQLSGTFASPPVSPWETLYISAGRKDKISKGDVAGLLLKKGGLVQAEVGMISLTDHAAYVAVASAKVAEVVRALAGQKIKNKKVKIEIAK